MKAPLALCGALLLAPPALAATEPAPLTLEEAVRTALAENEIPAIATVRIERAAALRRQAVAALVPRLTLATTYTRRAQEVTREVDGDEITVQAIDALNSQALAQATLVDLRALPLLRAATRGVAAQQLESGELERALAHDTATGFLLVLGAEQLRGAARERVRVAAKTVDEARLRLEAGLAGRNDATRAELELATARLAETRAANDVELSRQSLAFLVGREIGGRPLVEPADPPLPAGSFDDLSARALATRADLAALAVRHEQARQLAVAPRLGIVPRLDARGLYTATNEAGLSGREEDWNVAVTLTWELFDGGSRSAVAAQRDAEADEVELTLAQSRRSVSLEVSQTATALATSEASLVQAEARLAAARDNALEVRERYANGLATALEQADAAVEQFEAESELVRQRYARALSRLALARAIGLWPDGGSAPPAPGAPATDPSSLAAETSTR
jgi:outer membrane protein TolC